MTMQVGKKIKKMISFIKITITTFSTTTITTTRTKPIRAMKKTILAKSKLRLINK